MPRTTFKLGKCRQYTCECGAKPLRPLRANDTPHERHYPKPCDVCDASLDDRPWTIVDTMMALADKLGE